MAVVLALILLLELYNGNSYNFNVQFVRHLRKEQAKANNLPAKQNRMEIVSDS